MYVEHKHANFLLLISFQPFFLLHLAWIYVYNLDIYLIEKVEK